MAMSSSNDFEQWAYGIDRFRRARHGKTGIRRDLSVRSDGTVLTMLLSLANGICAICSIPTKTITTRLGRTYPCTRTRRSRVPSRLSVSRWRCRFWVDCTTNISERKFPTSTVVVNGKIYVTGGAAVLRGQNDPAIRFDGKPHDMCVGTNEEYDPVANTWRVRAEMPTARNHFLGAEVNGKIYAIGGSLGSTFMRGWSNTDITEEYDVAQDVWTTRAQMPTARSGVAGGVFKGRVYVAGGEFQNDKIMAAYRAFEAYDPATNTWDQSLPRMRIPRHGFAGAVIGDQLHVVAGDIQTAGIPGVTAYTDTHDVFDFTK